MSVVIKLKGEQQPLPRRAFVDFALGDFVVVPPERANAKPKVGIKVGTDKVRFHELEGTGIANYVAANTEYLVPDSVTIEVLVRGLVVKS